MARQIFQSRSRLRGTLVRSATIVPALLIILLIGLLAASALAPAGSSFELPPFVSEVLPTPAVSTAARTSSERPSASPEATASIGGGANATVASTAVLGRPGFSTAAPAAASTPTAPTTAPATPVAQPTVVPTAPPAQPTAHGSQPSTFPGRTPPPR